jgi:hypothetical protein
MYWDITSAKYLDGYRIQVCFCDGKSGIVDLTPSIEKGGIFSSIADSDEFKKFTIDPEWKVLSWLDGRLDIAPEAIYEEATGNSILQHVAESPEEYGNA